MFVNLNKKLDIIDRRYSRKGVNKGRKRLLVILILVLIALIVPSVFIFLGLKQASSHSKAIISAYKNQQFDSLMAETAATKNGLQEANISLSFLFWLRFIPFVGGYYSDTKSLASAGVEELSALDTILVNLEPAKTELGFDGHPKSGPERIAQAAKILDKSLPLLDKIQDNLIQAGDDVRDIDTSKYPDKISGRTVKNYIEIAKNFILGAAVAVKEGRAALTAAPELLGIPTPKRYLLLFQNDKEIRPTGGFITAYATLELNNGQLKSTSSDDIYRLDEQLLNVCLTKICPLTPPAPIVKYLPEVSGKPRTAWSLRDSNISPDVPTSAQEFERMYQLLGQGLPFDGIIYIDTQVVENLIELTGPIDIFGTTYSASIDQRCNCSNVIYELESYAEIAAKGEKSRKAILGVLMQQILARSIGANVQKLPQLISTIATLANQKHIMFYMHDPDVEKALSALNWTGEIKRSDGDYLHINDANFAGGKTNLYVEENVTYDIQIDSSGNVKNKVTINYENPHPYNRWLNGINRDYVRLYIPRNSQLISSRGSDDPVNTLDDANLDKTYFDAFIQVRPQNSRTLSFEYSIPYKPKGQYKLLIQKQPGSKDFPYTININGSTKAKFMLDQDKEFTFNI